MQARQGQPEEGWGVAGEGREGAGEGLTRVTEPIGYEELLGQLDPLLAAWYRERFPALSPPQALAVPRILAGENVLVSSPTGTGKTLTGFLAVLDYLFKLARAGTLEDRVYCVYVSPLKALANDIDRNLREPLVQMAQMAKERGEAAPRLRVGLRSGDTPQSKRAAMVRKPPHILITTPESLALVLAAPKFSQHLRGVTHLILDELHDLATSKRGTLLTLALEQLTHWLKEPPVRVGLSATLAPLETLAHFLAGYEGGRPRPCAVVETAMWKRLDLRVLCPVADGTRTPASLAWEKQMELVAQLIQKHTTTLIFTNTRASTERVLLRLRELGVEAVAAHHGAMSKEVRLKVERQLKGHRLKAVISSTSLELGLDIGDLDLVVQLGSPRSIAKGLQRVGRAGHALQAVAKGRFIAYEPDELLECAALVQEALAGKLDKVEPPELALDVLAQFLVGLSLHGPWEVERALALVRGAWPYRKLEREGLEELLNYLSSMDLATEGVYPKVNYDPIAGSFYPRRSSRLLYYLNVGTIPSQASYSVVLEATGQALGSLEEYFVERLRAGDVFVLGGRLYAYQGLRGSRVLVRDGQSRRPTIPSWGGEVAPRTRELSAAVSGLRERLAAEVGTLSEAEGTDGEPPLVRLAKAWESSLHLDQGAATTLASQLWLQMEAVGAVPIQRKLLVEGYLDPQERPGVLVHSPWGRRVNEAWSRALAHKLALEQGWEVGLTVGEEGFMLSLPARLELERVAQLVGPQELEPLLLRALGIQESSGEGGLVAGADEPLKLRFRNCAGRALAVLRNYRVQEVSKRRQRQRTQALLERLRSTDHPLLREALGEVWRDLWQVKEARDLLGELAGGRVAVTLKKYGPQVSPMGLTILLAGLAGTTTLQERWNLQQELHSHILARLIPEGEIGKPRFESGLVRSFFQPQAAWSATPEGVADWLQRRGACDLLEVDLPESTDEQAWRKAARKLIEGGAAVPVWTGEEERSWALAEQAGYYYGLYGRSELNRSLKAALERLRQGRRPRATHLIRGLRRAFLAGYDSQGRLVATTPPRPLPRSEALEWAVELKLRSLGPLDSRELAQALQLEEPEIARTLERLVQQGAVTAGRFVAEGAAVQYLDSEDCHHLELLAQGEAEVVGADQWLGFVWERSLARDREWQAALARLGGAAHPLPVWQRSDNLTLEEWFAALERGELLQARFRGGRLHTLPAQLVPLFVSCFGGGQQVQGLEQEVLELLRQSPEGLTRRELTLKLASRELDTARRGRFQPARLALAEAMRRLEGALRLHRRPLPGRSGRPLQRYLALPETPPVARAAERLLELLLQGHGPATAHQLGLLSGLEGEALSGPLLRLEKEGRLVGLPCATAQPSRLYLLAADREPLLAWRGRPPPPTLVHRQDPLALAYRRELNARYGEEWELALLEGGRPAGVVGLELKPGVVEVTYVRLARQGLWPALLAELDRLTGYYQQAAGKVLLWRRGGGGPLKQAPEEVADHFAAAGYLRRWDLLAKGELVEQSYPWERLLALMLARQHIHPHYRFESARAAILALQEVRDHYELSVRVKGPFNAPAEYAPTLGLVIAPGNTSAYSFMTLERARLRQAALAARPDEGMAQVLGLLPREGGLTREALVKRTRLERAALSRALKGLVKGLLVVKDPWGGYHRLEPEPGLSREEALDKLLVSGLEELGVASFEALARLLAGYCKEAELQHRLAGLDRRKVLRKGFVDQEEVRLYYLRAGQAGKLGAVSSFKGSYVLAPTDRLAQVLAPKVRQEFGLTGAHIICEGTSLVGAFKLRRRGRKVQVTLFEGGRAQRYVVDEWARQFHLELDWDL